MAPVGDIRAKYTTPCFTSYDPLRAVRNHHQRVRTPRKRAQEDNCKNKGAGCIYKLHPMSLNAPRRGDLKRQPAPLLNTKVLAQVLDGAVACYLLAVPLTAFQRIIFMSIYQEQKQSDLELHVTARLRRPFGWGLWLFQVA